MKNLTAPEKRGPVRPTILRQELNYFLQVLGISAFATAQPVLDVMGKSPETFIFRGAGTTGIVLFAVMVAVVPALALSVIAATTRLLGPRIRRGAHLVILGAMTSVIALQVMKKTTPLRDVVLVVTAVVAGAALLWLFARVRAAAWAPWAALAPLAFLLIFLLVSPVSKLVLPSPAGAVAQDAADPVPVVLVVFDEFPVGSLLDRSGQINSTMYPNFADLASQSTWYRNYTVTERLTNYSIPTVVTGNIVTDRSKDALAADYPNNMFTLLSETHRLKVVEPLQALCPEELCFESEADSEEGGENENNAVRQAHGGLSGLLSDAVLVWSELSSPDETTRDLTAQFEELADEDEVIDEAPTDEAEPAEKDPLAGLDTKPERRRARRALYGTFVESIRPGEPPSVHFLHSLLPHGPWNRYPDGQEYQVPQGPPPHDVPLARGGTGDHKLWIEESWPLQLTRQRHLIQIQYTDRLLGLTMDRLREAGIFDEALVIITADHGVGLHPGRERRAPTPENMHEIFWVPLFIKAPHQQEGVVDDRNLMAPDVLPTIADILDTEIPWKVDGRSALDPDTDRGPIKTIVRREDPMLPWPEETLTIPGKAAQRRIRREAFVPAGDCTRELCPYLVGPGASLIGDPLASFTIGPPSNLSANLVLPHTLRTDDNGAVPGLVLGTLAGVGEEHDGRVAVAMNGAIAGVSETWTQEGVPGWFGVLTPQSILRPGQNDLRLYEVDGSLLRPISFR